LGAVYSITVDAVGSPGARIFYLQIQTTHDDLITFLLEKTQAILLAEQLDDLLAALSQQFPTLALVDVDPVPALQPPESVRFRAGKFGLQYESTMDLIDLEIRELVGTDRQAATINFWITRRQARTLSTHAQHIARQGVGH
jgi:uncharacterized repeat protein (TIGR03847 family)